jgi:hypothetical protein
MGNDKIKIIINKIILLMKEYKNIIKTNKIHLFVLIN